MCDHPKIQVPENATNFQKYYFPYKKTASKCVIIRDFSKSQKMLSKLYQVSEALFPTLKTASKCVIRATR